MTAYQKFWNQEIENLLKEINASDALYDELKFVLSNYKLT